MHSFTSARMKASLLLVKREQYLNKDLSSVYQTGTGRESVRTSPFPSEIGYLTINKVQTGLDLLLTIEHSWNNIICKYEGIANPLCDVWIGTVKRKQNYYIENCTHM